MTPEEIKETRAYSDRIRHGPMVSGKEVAIIIDRAIDAIAEESARADQATLALRKLHIVTERLMRDSDLDYGPELEAMRGAEIMNEGTTPWT